MRFGGPVLSKFSNPAEWISELKRLMYNAAYCPVDSKQSDAVIKSYVDAAKLNNIIISEVGAWSNPLSSEETTRKKATSYCKEQLYLADKVGALCCVNISGSRGELWDGPHPDNLTRETFEMIVDVVRDIIDSVKPKKTFYALELMPWMYPDSTDSYLELIKAIDREHFAVHLDPVNIISSPQKYYCNGDIIKDCFQRLGPYIKSCHVKDISLAGDLTVHLSEVIIGKGSLDYSSFINEVSRVNPEIPLMLEHLSCEEDYTLAAENMTNYIKKYSLK
ncbi:MAG TPA: TIM barrel protein [Clostridiaceae bacterium]